MTARGAVSRLKGAGTWHTLTVSGKHYLPAVRIKEGGNDGVLSAAHFHTSWCGDEQ